ncbi:hypothetical protein GTA08_BOTSDO08503 [Neofusicoccum parvum]|uniref:Uncharacterized protein n=1 Tax=Neofusicoccum parvum TaxID=310453 RepID=A0ACB5SB85_9PEZI|nr:hypothetical protein GTA08_BOTSDO08503 [Neofusicoccum parvum]
MGTYGFATQSAMIYGSGHNEQEARDDMSRLHERLQRESAARALQQLSADSAYNNPDPDIAAATERQAQRNDGTFRPVSFLPPNLPGEPDGMGSTRTPVTVSSGYSVSNTPSGQLPLPIFRPPNGPNAPKGPSLNFPPPHRFNDSPPYGPTSESDLISQHADATSYNLRSQSRESSQDVSSSMAVRSPSDGYGSEDPPYGQSNGYMAYPSSLIVQDEDEDGDGEDEDDDEDDDWCGDDDPHEIEDDADYSEKVVREDVLVLRTEPQPVNSHIKKPEEDTTKEDLMTADNSKDSMDKSNGTKRIATSLRSKNMGYTSSFVDEIMWARELFGAPSIE